MSTELILTLTAFLLAACVAAFAIIRANRPVEPMQVRLIDYNYIALPALIALVAIGAHLVTLIVGHPVTGGGR